MAAPQDPSLRSLELFQICAKRASLQAAAEEAGLSVSTVSHHLQTLERRLGVALFDHSRRPMVLTPAGRRYLKGVEPALVALRRARAEAALGEGGARDLRLGSIEDFDAEIMPELAVDLSAALPGWGFVYQTDVSRALMAMLRARELDLGVVALPPEKAPQVQVRPLLRDPFVLVAPRGVDDPEALLTGEGEPFLRFSAGQFIAQQIEAQLRRLKLAPAGRFECGNAQTLMAMVAGGAGWTIMTPLLFARGERFHGEVAMHPFPGKSFARELAVVSTPDCPDSVLDLVDERLRGLIRERALAPVHEAAPWLEDGFRLLD
ncbi:MAG: LysR family transcriptional regulator [Pseudomonadota bacterium]